MKKLLFSILTLCLLTGCSDKETETNESKVQELSLNDDKVVEIINKFNIVRNDTVSYTYGESSEGMIYTNEGLSEMDLYKLARSNSMDSMQKDNKCNTKKYCKGDDCEYQCKYISYKDYNDAYKKLTGKDLSKSDIAIDLIKYEYDSENDVYRECMYFGGGGTDLVLTNKLEKAEQDGDYIYIYEKVAFVWPNSNYDGYIIRKHDNTVVEIGNYDTANDAIENAIENHLNNFDTFKWTFKKDANGEYIYESLKYVQQ